MPRVVFTPNLRRHVECEPRDVEGTTLHDALNAVFAAVPELRGYVLDDQSRLRRHVTAYIDNNRVRDRVTLTDPVSPSSEIYVMQALSGG